MSDPEIAFGAEVVEVGEQHRTASWCLVRFRRPDGLFGMDRVHLGDWPSEYWPPRVGDLIRVVSVPTVTLIGRLREGVGHAR